MKITIENKTIELNDYYCQLDDNPLVKVEKPYVNLYVQFNGCNASCLFCESKNPGKPFMLTDYVRCMMVLSESKVEVKKISFTGGEPTLNYSEFIYCVELARKMYPKAFITVNTNGINIEKLIRSDAYLLFDSIAISRHHYIDERNNMILGFFAPSFEMIKRLLEGKDKSKFHLSCNLLKSGIFDRAGIINYIYHAHQMGIDDIGFVSLMKVNDFAKQQYVDFNSIDIESRRCYKTKTWKKEGMCECSNYLYITDDLKIISIYNRHVISGSNKSSLIFNGVNLIHGFNGEIIY